jgi:hypothetical protein
MSSSFDFLESIFRDRFEAKSGDLFEHHLFQMALSDIHSANHDLQDAINRNARLRKTIDELKEHLKGENDDQ